MAHRFQSSAGFGVVSRHDAGVRADTLQIGHNPQENRAGSYRTERIVFATSFGAGLRVHDLAEPAEIAHWCGPTPDGQSGPRPQPWLRERPEEAEAA
jgi:hypothetical protein